MHTFTGSYVDVFLAYAHVYFGFSHLEKFVFLTAKLKADVRTFFSNVCTKTTVCCDAIKIGYILSRFQALIGMSTTTTGTPEKNLFWLLIFLKAFKAFRPFFHFSYQMFRRI